MFLRQMYYFQQIMRNQWKSPQQLKKLQEKKLRHLLHHAYRNTPFYHRKFREAEVHPDDFQSLGDLEKFPITTKGELRQNYPHNALAKGYSLSNGVEMHTSGSTGRVFTFFCSHAALDYHMVISYRNFVALGYRPWEKIVYTRYTPLEIGGHWYDRFGLVRRLHVNVFEPVKAQVEFVRQHQPKAITGYPSILLEWAKIIEKEDIEIQPRFIRTEAELLTTEAREYMEQVFGCHVYEEYGSSEMIQYAFECKERGYHLSADNAVMEFLEDGESVAPGEQGEIFATSLAKYGMPFIRYQLFDWGVPAEGSCSCGRGLPLMKLIVGRNDDFVTLPSGKKVGPRLMIPPFELIPRINEFRLIQEKKELIVIEIIKGEEYTQATEDTLKQNLLDILGEPVELRFNYVDEIPRGRHNRPRPLISKVRA
ncbi:MAG: phenylacetate--CoA ligase family protein [Theionarchaea archaeon]|nr:phenylacetate--CoA ligase family protein [Theionarchaea archaeon]